MMLISKLYRYALLLSVLGVFLGKQGVNAQESDGVQEVVELNKKALAAFGNLEMEEAANLLKKAFEVCSAQKLEQHPAAARTHIHMGVVYVAGLKQRDQGLEEFKKALRIDPTIKVTRSMLSPEVQSAYQEALMEVSQDEVAPPVAPTARPTTPAEPSPPAQEAGGVMVHTPVTAGTTGQPITIRVMVPRSLGAGKVILAYRPSGVIEYLKEDLAPGEAGRDWYLGQIPAEATGGESVAYYILAQNPEGQPVAKSGSESEPHTVALGAGVGNGAESSSTGQGGQEEGDEEEGGGLSFWAAVSLGSGFGYHSGSPEANRTNDSGVKLKSSGLAMSRLVQINPEIGFFYSDSLVLSLQGRFQLVSGASQVKGSDVANNGSACKGGTCKPASLAVAALAKATWFLGEPKRIMPFVTLAAGAGQIRQVIDVGKLSGCPAGGCKDTIVGGPVLFGPGVGLSVDLGDTFSLVASANALVGVPNLLANLDLSLGFSYVR